MIFPLYHVNQILKENKKMKKITQKLLLLTVMLTGLAGLTIGTSNANGNNALPCCSECEENPMAPLCRFGCSRDC